MADFHARLPGAEEVLHSCKIDSGIGVAVDGETIYPNKAHRFSCERRPV